MLQAENHNLTHSGLSCGGATQDITPSIGAFLHGYPGVARNSVGVHDPLECNALWLESNGSATLLLANDLVYVGKSLVARVRDRISKAIPIAREAILITATHTHSGPVMVDLVSELDDPIVPKTDPSHLKKIEDAMVRAASEAYANRRPAEAGWSIANAKGIGTNRHDIHGPSDLDVPVLAIRAIADGQLVAVSLICSMHPTVLHEDSLFLSGDFLGIARQQIREHFNAQLPVLIHLGACGNQSPRHVTQANTFAEASRIARCLSEPVCGAIARSRWTASPAIFVAHDEVELSVRALPEVKVAASTLLLAEQALAARSADGSPRTSVRTAECDLFGAQATFRLAKAQAQGRLLPAIKDSQRAEVMVVRVGEHQLIAWPGEWFVEFQLAIRSK